MIQAIQTSYKGYRFRSRLEARWAVFFDALGLKWEYEPEGFDLGEAGYYLPDFRVQTPQGNVRWYEVKPEGVFKDEKFTAFMRAMSDVAAARSNGGLSAYGYLLSGDPTAVLDPTCCPVRHVCPRCGFIGPLDGGVYEHGDTQFWCYPCDTETSDGSSPVEPRGGVLGTTVQPHKGTILVDEHSWSTFKRHLRIAALQSRAARFEHGESGAPR